MKSRATEERNKYKILRLTEIFISWALWSDNAANSYSATLYIALAEKNQLLDSGWTLKICISLRLTWFRTGCCGLSWFVQCLNIDLQFAHIMFEYWPADFISSEEPAVFRERSLRKHELQETDDVHGQIYEHICEPNGGWTVFIILHMFLLRARQNVTNDSPSKLLQRTICFFSFLAFEQNEEVYCIEHQV